MADEIAWEQRARLQVAVALLSGGAMTERLVGKVYETLSDDQKKRGPAFAFGVCSQLIADAVLYTSRPREKNGDAKNGHAREPATSAPF